MGYKLNAILSHYAEENHPNPCSLEQPDYEDARESRVKITRLIRDQLKNTKKTSSIFFADFGGDTTKEEVSEDEFCALVDKKLNEHMSSSCISSSLRQNLMNTSFLDMGFADACRALWDDVKSSRQKCIEDAQRVSRRDPPGEEIAPAEETKPAVNTPSLATPAGFVGPKVIIPSRKSSGRGSSTGASSQ